MFPHLSNDEFFIFILTLWAIWFFLSTLHDIHQWRGQQQKKKGKRRQLKPQSPHDCELCRLGLHEPEPKGPRQVTPWPQIKNPSGHRKRSNSEGKACPRCFCDYSGISDSLVHALVMHLGGRKKQDAQPFIHRVKEKLATGCLPLFTSDGLRMYFYAFTAHFSAWVWPDGAREFHWQTDEHLLYGQFRKVRNGF